MASVGCPGRRTCESIAGSGANVWLSAECTRSHQTGSLSITGELREHALALPPRVSACLPRRLMGITIARVRAFWNRCVRRCEGRRSPGRIDESRVMG